MTPWDHQIRLTAQTLEAIAQGERRICLQLATGGGKTKIMEMLALDFLTRGKSVVCYTNRQMLVAQMSKAMMDAGIYHGVRADGYDEELEHRFQISSVQTEESRVYKKKEWKLHRADLVIVDECFVGETEILTPTGPRRIDNMRCGDMVYCASGLGVVESVSCRTSPDIFQLEFSNGTYLICTGGHKIFTSGGWIEASRLVDGAISCGPETLRFLWNNISSAQMDKSRRKRKCHRGKALEQAALLLSILCQEIEESDERKPFSIKDEGHASKDTSSSLEAWRERAVASLGPACDFARLGRGLGIRGSGSNRNATRNGVSHGLQDRCGQFKPEDWDRIRRPLPRRSRKEIAGLQKDGTVGQVRLVSLSRLKRACPVPVFNLHISGHPSYFANGHLVHNCHVQVGPVVQKILCDHIEQGASYVGFTATPLGLAEIYTHLIGGVTMQELRDCGALVPAVHFAADEPDFRAWKKLKKKWALADGEDPSQRQQGEIMMTPTIFGRVWEWAEKLNPGFTKPVLLFGPSVEGSMWFAEQFTKKGISAAHIDGYDVWFKGRLWKSDPKAREDMRNAHKDGKLKVVTNRYVLREGVDWPWIEHIILAFVAGSLQTFLQTVGRGLRSYLGKTDCVIQDHGSAWWRHGSVNVDRDWRLDMDDRMAFGLRQERMRRKWCDGCKVYLETKATSCPECFTELRGYEKPFRCPKCGRVWQMGRECKEQWGGCGFVLHPGMKFSRPVVGTDGELRMLEGDLFQPRRISTVPNGPEVWKKMYWRSRSKRINAAGKEVGCDRTFNAAMALFAQENYWSWPDRRWPLMPVSDLDLFAHVKDVPMDRLVPDTARIERFR